jgi:fatty acid desaturase
MALLLQGGVNETTFCPTILVGFWLFLFCFALSSMWGRDACKYFDDDPNAVDNHVKPL